jgi:hypothetical protein
MLRAALESFCGNAPRSLLPKLIVGQSGSHRYLSEAGEVCQTRPNRVEPRKKRLCHCTEALFLWNEGSGKEGENGIFQNAERGCYGCF